MALRGLSWDRHIFISTCVLEAAMGDPVDTGSEHDSAKTCKTAPAAMRYAEHERFADMQPRARQRLEICLSCERVKAGGLLHCTRWRTRIATLGNA
jgi:hypothetical protein